jgi:hypothetical protein
MHHRQDRRKNPLLKKTRTLVGSLMANSLGWVAFADLSGNLLSFLPDFELCGRNIGKLATSVNFSPSGNVKGKES